MDHYDLRPLWHQTSSAELVYKRTCPLRVGADFNQRTQKAPTISTTLRPWYTRHLFININRQLTHQQAIWWDTEQLFSATSADNNKLSCCLLMLLKKVALCLIKWLVDVSVDGWCWWKSAWCIAAFRLYLQDRRGSHGPTGDTSSIFIVLQLQGKGN